MSEMTQADLLAVLGASGFPEHYWALCARHPYAATGQMHRSLTKQEIMAAFTSLGLEPRYDARDRSITIDLGGFGGRTWQGVFAASRSGGLELIMAGSGEQDRIGSNFAVLAYDAKRHVDPSFFRDRFGDGPPPYPRPSHNGQSDKLADIVGGFVDLLASAQEAIESRSA
jgi:hypothetical protein